MRILTRYVLREFFLYFTLALTATTFILILRRVFLLTKQFVQKDVSLWYMAELILYALPSILALTVPMAVLAGFLMALGQLSFTGEVTAIRASGVGIHQLTLPALIVGLLFSAFDYWIMDVALPWGNTQYINLRANIARQNPALILEVGAVMRALESHELLWLYERKNPKTGRLENIRVWQDYRDGRPKFSVASEGLIAEEDGRSALILYDGISYEQNDGERAGDATRNRFTRQTLYLPIDKDIERTDHHFKDYRSMSLADLRTEIAALDRSISKEQSGLILKNRTSARNRATIEAHKKFSIPFACVAFALVSVPLGVTTRRSGFMVGLVVGLPLIIVYYTMLRIGETLGIQGSLAPAMGAWMPNLLPLALGVVLTIRMARR